MDGDFFGEFDVDLK